MTPRPLDLSDDPVFEGLLRDALLSAGDPPPFPLDVSARVMSGVADMGPAPAGSLGLAQLGRWAAAAAVIGVAMLVTAFAKAPALSEIVQGVGTTTAETATTAARAGAVATVTLGALLRAGAALFDAFRGPLESSAPWHGAAVVTMAGLAVLMLGVTTYVVGRDFRTTAP